MLHRGAYWATYDCRDPDQPKKKQQVCLATSHDGGKSFSSKGTDPQRVRQLYRDEMLTGFANRKRMVFKSQGWAQAPMVRGFGDFVGPTDPALAEGPGPI